MSPAGPPLGSPAVRAAKRRPQATVALDLRWDGEAAAVAVDGRGRLVAWAVVSGGVPGELARRALRELKVKPKRVLALLGAGEAQVAVLNHPGEGEPGPEEIAAALFAEGYERLSEPAVAAFALSADAWLVAACGTGAVEPLAADLLTESGVDPAFVVDQLLAAVLVGPGEAARRVESGEAALLDALAGELPAIGDETLPEACEPAWHLALHPTVPALASPRSERRRASLAWARRAAWIALVLAALGALLMLEGLRLTLAGLARNRGSAAQSTGDAKLLRELKEIGAMAGEAQRLGTDLAGKRAPWPRVAEPVAALARQLPPEVGWERLQVKDGVLELEASAAGPAPQDRLETLRHNLERSPGILNLSWGAPDTDPKTARLRQVFRATLREAPPAAAPQGSP
jgi:Tfp pilus assembly protein PilN